MTAARRIRAFRQLLRWEVGLDLFSVRCARLLHARLPRKSIGTLQLTRLLGVSIFRGLRPPSHPRAVDARRDLPP